MARIMTVARVAKNKCVNRYEFNCEVWFYKKQPNPKENIT
ncbi:hypothetical protein MC7420_2679 [Coleofasciculus chthonoplastes PCC 7420]|uniref:Uncharacterized protein n=1 Tax=Coleofasciculus chthonoplastes PCC 7420 TaxID=118168 RepID=B4VYL8_9CYAN|nr:hypothetical protein MC7420_2679 [Coleofasciculus chthonoplastes PCC 7420]